MKKNYTTPPNGAGMLTELTGLNLRSDVYPSKNIFQKRPIFIDNNVEMFRLINNL